MRRVLPGLVFRVQAAPANATPTVAVQATPALGAAPLDVTLTATGDDTFRTSVFVPYLAQGAHGPSVVRVVHVLTGATGNTPIGRWRVYSKVPGFLPGGMFYSSFFIGAFAIHGYPSVPPYPASHGCVRTPMWIAPTLFAANDYGETVYIYA